MSKPNRKKPSIPTKVSSSWDTSCEKLKEEASQTQRNLGLIYPTPSKSFLKNQISFGTSLLLSFR
jgi:hypothetical protein